MRRKSAYQEAGVNIDLKMRLLSKIKKQARSTFNKNVLSEIGCFGGFYRSPGKDEILVSSTDGVGTKLKVAVMAHKHDTVGQDIVNHCVNDILVHGARPLFFLDYVGTSKLEGTVFSQLISGLSKACRANGCALIGGETAELPGLYPAGEYDLVGTIVGSVRRQDLITGAKIKPGQVIIGLRSNGLHTNGYSLARKIIFEKAKLKISSKIPGTKTTVAQALLATHRSYLKPIQAVREHIPILGMAHITGGGFADNIPRVLPRGVQAVIDRAAWPVPPLFRYLQKCGKIAPEEAYRVFNMGVGLVLITTKKAADTALAVLAKAKEKAWIIGHTEAGDRDVRFIN